MMAREPHTRTLERLIRELAAQPAPELDWSRLEAELAERLGREPMPRDAGERGRRVFSLRLVLAAAATLLALFGWSVIHAPRVTVLTTPAAPALSAPIDGDALGLGVGIESGDRSLVVEHSGRARWTLLPHGRARMARKGSELTVTLDAGALIAEVVPSSTPESFAVEVRETRIAVRGTLFRVELGPDRVRVAVLRGSVVVGSTANRGHTQGFVLTAPMAGGFSLDGARSGQVEGSETAPVTKARLHPTGSSSPSLPAVPSAGVRVGREVAAAPVSAPTPSYETLPQPSALPGSGGFELDVVVQKVVSAVNQCLADQTPARGDILVSVSFELRIVFGAGGSVTELGFDPPLPEAVERCSREAARAVRLPGTGKRLSVQRRVSLHR